MVFFPSDENCYMYVSVMPDGFNDIIHLSQFPEFFDWVSMIITKAYPRLMLMMIS